MGNPHHTHLKQKLFGEDYSKIYSRKINAEKIYLAHMLYKVIKDNANLLNNISIHNYGLSLFFFSYALSEILKEDPVGLTILNNPRDYVTTSKGILMQSLKRLWELITPDINFEIEEYTEAQNGFFDYKNVFKNSQFVKSMASKIKADYVRLIRRDDQYSFSSIYNSQLNQNSSSQPTNA